MIRGVRALAALGVAVLAVSPLTAGASSAAGWHVVTFDGRITQADRAALVDAGARSPQYVPADSYVAWLPSGAAVADVPSVAAVSALAPTKKVDPALRGTAASVLVTVLADAPTLSLPALDAAGTVLWQGTAHPALPVREVVLLTTPAGVDALAARAEVLYVGPASPGLQAEDEVSDQIQAGNHNGTTPSVGYEPWLSARGLDGTGVRVSVTDTGIDETHPDLAGRVVAKVEYGALPGTGGGETEDIGGHGTHVSGIIGGDPAAHPGIGRIVDGAGFLMGLGVAPNVSFVDQNVIGNFSQGGWPPSYGWDKISRDAVRNGSVAWNASWNSLEGTGVGYINSARTLDIMVRDADWQTEGAEPITMVFSAGNGGGTTSTITAPKEAKNIITVGSSRSSRIGSMNSISSFSSKGPARDGRILPNVAAPGEFIVSSRSRFPGGSCNPPGTTAVAAELFARGLGFYTTCSGTSMATPHVAGAVALIHQWWKGSHDGADPSPAMDKALLINSATDMGTADIPNKNEGWGRVDLGRLFDPNTSYVALDQSQVLSEPGGNAVLEVRAVDPAKPMRVSLVWTDAPGNAGGGTTKALVNDLDLSVTAADGTRFLGNVFAAGKSAAGGFADRKNNLENVFLPTPDGTYIIEVSAFDLPGDGVPFVGDETDQDFALVVSNAEAIVAP
jgi:subtilisin family serine protease